MKKLPLLLLVAILLVPNRAFPQTTQPTDKDARGWVEQQKRTKLDHIKGLEKEIADTRAAIAALGKEKLSDVKAEMLRSQLSTNEREYQNGEAYDKIVLGKTTEQEAVDLMAKYGWELVPLAPGTADPAENDLRLGDKNIHTASYYYRKDSIRISFEATNGVVDSKSK